MQEEPNKYVKELTQEKYKYGFTTEVHTDIIERGLNEDVIRLISAKKNEPEWLLEFRLKAYRYWLTMEMPAWAHLTIPEIDYQAISYYADPTKKKEGPKSMDEVDPELIKTFNKLGIPLEEQMALSGMAVDAVMDSVSVKTTFKETLLEKGIIFCSFREQQGLAVVLLGQGFGHQFGFFDLEGHFNTALEGRLQGGHGLQFQRLGGREDQDVAVVLNERNDLLVGHLVEQVGLGGV